MKRYHLRQYGWTSPALSGREISQSEKDTLCNLTYTHTYAHKHQAQWYTENRLVAARGRGWVVEKWRTVFVLFLLKFKCTERKPKSPTMTGPCCSLTLTNLGMCASAAPPPSSWHTHTHTHRSSSLSSQACRHGTRALSAWRALALPFSMTRISFKRCLWGGLFSWKPPLTHVYGQLCFHAPIACGLFP